MMKRIRIQNLQNLQNLQITVLLNIIRSTMNRSYLKGSRWLGKLMLQKKTMKMIVRKKMIQSWKSIVLKKL